MKNQEFYDHFLDWLAISHSKETVQSYRWGLKMFIDWIDGKEKKVAECKEKDFVDYSVYLLERRKVKNSTLSHYFCALRTFWSWMYRNEFVQFDDDKIPVPKNNDKEHYPFVYKKEIDKMSSVFDEYFPDQLRDKAIVLFLYATGVRLSEMIAINVSQINFEKQKAIIKTYKRDNHFREIYWDDDTNELLHNWTDMRDNLMREAKVNSDALFISLHHNNRGARIGKCAVQRMFRRVRNQAGIDRKITAHSMRHGFGKKAVEKNVHPRHLQLMLGHAKLNTTMFYMGVENKEIEKVYRNKMT